MPEAQEAEQIEQAVEKSLVAQRQELQKLPGTALFYAALESFFVQAEEQARIALRGVKTLEVSAKNFLSRHLETEEDFKNCAALAIEAGNREKKAADAFTTATEFLFRAHKAAVAIRAIATAPFAKLRTDLAAHAQVWADEQRELKKKAEADIAQASKQASSNLAEQAQEQYAMGYVEQGNELMRQARLAATPVTLPPAAPSVPGGRIDNRWEIEVVDIVAAAKAIVNGKFPLMHSYKPRGASEATDVPLLMLDERVLRGLVDRHGETIMKQLPGIKVTAKSKLNRTGKAAK